VKLTSTVKVLHGAVAHAANAIPNRPTVPILAGVRLTADTDRLRVEAFNYEMATSATETVDVGEPGAVLVSGRMLLDMLGRLPAGPVTLEVARDGLTLTAGRAMCVLPLLPIEDYPQLPDLPGTVGDIDGRVFGDELEWVALAAGQDETLPVLRTVRLEAAAEHLRLVATDRHRLHSSALPFPLAGADWAGLLPIDAVKAMSRLDTAMTLCGDDSTVAAVTAGRTTSVRQIDGTYPRWQSLIIPGEHTLTVPVGPLSDALRRCALVTIKAPAVLTVNRDALGVAAGDQERVLDEVDAEYDGPPMTVGVNPAFLAAALGAATGDRARIKLISPIKPLVIDSGGDDSGRLALMMPVRINE